VSDRAGPRESRVIVVQYRTIGSIDASLDRTRLFFNLESNQYSTDVLTLQGFVPIPPGTKARVTVEYVADEGGA